MISPRNHCQKNLNQSRKIVLKSLFSRQLAGLRLWRWTLQDDSECGSIKGAHYQLSTRQAAPTFLQKYHSFSARHGLCESLLTRSQPYLAYASHLKLRAFRLTHISEQGGSHENAHRTTDHDRIAHFRLHFEQRQADGHDESNGASRTGDA